MATLERRTYERVHQRQLMTRGLQRLHQRIAWRAYSRWCTYLREIVRARELAQTMLMRVCNADVSAAFSGWSSAVARKLRLRHLMQRCLTRFSQHLLHRAWLRWREHTHERVHQRQLVTRGLQRLHQRIAWRVFCRWYASVFQCSSHPTERDLQEFEQQTLSRLHALETVMHRAVDHIDNFEKQYETSSQTYLSGDVTESSNKVCTTSYVCDLSHVDMTLCDM